MNQDLIYVLAGIAVALATSLLKKEQWSPQTKRNLNYALSVAAGFIATYLHSKNLDAKQILATSAAAAGFSGPLFDYVLKTTGLEGVLAGVGSAPTPNPAIPAPAAPTVETPLAPGATPPAPPAPPTPDTPAAPGA